MIGLIVIIIVCSISLGSWMQSTSDIAGFNAFKDLAIAVIAGAVLWFNY